jgi:glycosyltransferase involved in cell wall biosynthesis
MSYHSPALTPDSHRPVPATIRVFHLCDKFGIRGARTHGVSRLFSWWFPRFDAAEFELRLIGIRPPDEASAHLERQGLAPLCLGRHRFSPRIATDLLALVRRDRPHILHAHGYATSNYARAVGLLTGARVIVHEHAAFPTIPGYQRAADRLLARAADLGIAVSASTREFMVRRRAFPADRVRVVFNGAPLDEFKRPDAEARRAQRERLGFGAGDLVIGTVGRLDHQKGTTYFLQAAAHVHRLRSRTRFVVAGDGHLLEEHRAEAQALGIAEHTTFTGFCEDVPALQSALDMQVFPSLWEGTPLTVFEAMSMGLPIVSTAVDGLAEVLRHRENALLVPPRDPEALAAGMLQLVDDAALAAQLGARAEQDSRRFDVCATVRALETIYRELAGARS